MDKLLDSFETVFGNGFLKYFKEQEKKHHYFKLNDYKKIIQKFVEDEQRDRVNYYRGSMFILLVFCLLVLRNLKVMGDQ